MPKNIVLCLDGTGNEFEKDNSNVLKLHSTLVDDGESQVTYYAPGVGTFSPTKLLTRPGQAFGRLLGLAFGLGYRQLAEEAYWFVVENYEAGDRIYIYGYSRGAYLARIVAALIFGVGLLRKGNRHLVSYALAEIELRGKKRDLDFEHLGRFRKQFSQDLEPKPYLFLGLWDTVSSVSWAYDYLAYAFTASNPRVSACRHAVSLDERRAFFAQNLVKQRKNQDTKEVWFAGSHGDVGGGFPEDDNGLSKITLEWMIAESDELEGGGPLFDKARVLKVLGENDLPRYTAAAHTKMSWKWWWAEFFPKQYAAWPIPVPHLFRRRRVSTLTVKELADRLPLLHESLVQRIEDPKLKYTPRNIPENYDVEPRREIHTLPSFSGEGAAQG